MLQLAQVADISTQTPPLPQPSLPAPLPPLRTSSSLDAKDAQTALYGVNAAVASSRGANGAVSDAFHSPKRGLATFTELRQAMSRVYACSKAVTVPQRHREGTQADCYIQRWPRGHDENVSNALQDIGQNRRWRCAGKTVYASTVNVRDKVAAFIVGLAGMSDRWDKDASPALLRCRNGLGRSSDPKVVALRQAVLEKCMALKGPPPNLGLPPTNELRKGVPSH